MKYNKAGDLVGDEESVYAESSEIDLGNATQKKFYVLTSNGGLFDPRGPDSHRERTVRKELRITNEKTFEYYVQYLKTKNTLFMRRAERSYING